MTRFYPVKVRLWLEVVEEKNFFSLVFSLFSTYSLIRNHRLDSTPMEVEGFLYEALSPISLSTSGHPPPPPALDSEPYQVFRNEISLSAVESHSPTAAAPDYFSLHLDADDETTVDLIPVSSVAANTPVKEPEKRLEGGWFRANCRFRSPMLQLHKEILDFCNFLSPTPEGASIKKCCST